ncbi:MAG: DUF933 domain-containing protein [Nitrospinota bacterium]
MKVALIGLPGSGKSTVFSALTGAGVDLRSGGRAETHLAVVPVPDPRVESLAEMFSSKKAIHATIEYADVAGLGKGGRTLDDSFLAAVRDADALSLVIGAFADAPGAEAELESVHLELVLSDLQVVEARLKRIEAEIGKGRKEGVPERDALLRCRKRLEDGLPLRAVDFGAEEEKLLRGYAFLSRKPLLVVFNTAEDRRDFDLPPEGNARTLVSYPKTGRISFCAALESEVLAMGEEAEAFALEMGLQALSRDKVLWMTYDLLGLITFLTANEKESHAWPIPEGTTALRAAGLIHSDLQRGFIRAETISYEELSRAGSWAESRSRGLLRVEGKDYVVQEGDVILFRFNV